MYGKEILCGNLNVTFEISHKIYYPYIERCGFYSQGNDLRDLIAHKCFFFVVVAKAVVRQKDKHYSFGIWCTYIIYFTLVPND